MEAASETTTDQEDQTKDRESGGERELTKGTGKPYLSNSLYRGSNITGGCSIVGVSFTHRQNRETFIFHSFSVVAY